jgi:putative pyruvate formate lyase activating enzyme
MINRTLSIKPTTEGVTFDRDISEILAPLESLRDCTCCPRDCHADRGSAQLGYCRSGMGFSIGSICAHRGEEPVITGKHGICNIFFTHCNMQCVYCQNWQISHNRQVVVEHKMELSEVVSRIEAILDAGSRSVGFVSPSHFIPQVRVIMSALRARGRKPVYVFNTSSYDKKATIESFDGEFDVYLPDLKYMDDRLAEAHSDTPGYSAVACAAIKEMFRQKGSSIWLDDDGLITSGLIIRHLVMPGQVENSKAVLRWIAHELSPSVHVSLMAQYRPTPRVAKSQKLGRYITPQEYDEVLEEFHHLGFYRGWVQELDAPENYTPDFVFDHPFER